MRGSRNFRPAAAQAIRQSGQLSNAEQLVHTREIIH